MNKWIFLFCFLALPASLFSQKISGEEVKLLGVENPVSFALSPDGLRMIVIDAPKKEPIRVKKLYRPYLESSWGAANPVESLNQKMKPETIVEAPFIDHDGKNLFFAANFDDSFGGTDLYCCSFHDGICGEPVNLGEPVNSPENESSPTLSGNRRTLFFTRPAVQKRLELFDTHELWNTELDSSSTNWLLPQKVNTIVNNGGLTTVKMANDNHTILYARIDNEKDKWQLYWAKRLGDIHWYLPKAIDTLNTRFSELCPVYCPNDGFIYFLQNKGTDKRPECTLYRFPLNNAFVPEKTIVVQGTVRDPVDRNPLSANLLVSDPVLGRIKYFTRSNDSDGSFSMILNAGEELMFHVWEPGYSHVYRRFTPEQTEQNLASSFSLFDSVRLELNIYDREELWPLPG
ncbi:MAG TPA: hypothetical protein PLK12_13640, partial [Prolixibacteraceae bacterium]|nr:hypothetical protein [Prolixibacteraceae bacterium]